MTKLRMKLVYGGIIATNADHIVSLTIWSLLNMQDSSKGWKISSGLWR